MGDLLWSCRDPMCYSCTDSGRLIDRRGAKRQELCGFVEWLLAESAHLGERIAALEAAAPSAGRTWDDAQP